METLARSFVGQWCRVKEKTAERAVHDLVQVGVIEFAYQQKGRGHPTRYWRPGRVTL
jgi:predicted ArsR family transcriptional regulator